MGMLLLLARWKGYQEARRQKAFQEKRTQKSGAFHLLNGDGYGSDHIPHRRASWGLLEKVRKRRRLHKPVCASFVAVFFCRTPEVMPTENQSLHCLPENVESNACSAVMIDLNAFSSPTHITMGDCRPNKGFGYSFLHYCRVSLFSFPPFNY